MVCGGDVRRRSAVSVNAAHTRALLQRIVDARTNSMDDVSLVALIESWRRRARRLLGTPKRTRKTTTKRARFDYRQDDAILSVYRVSEGGEGYRDAAARLHDAGIPCTRADSIYVGHYGIRVAAKHEKRAQRILWGK